VPSLPPPATRAEVGLMYLYAHSMRAMSPKGMEVEGVPPGVIDVRFSVERYDRG
jgi:hypothetical protein